VAQPLGLGLVDAAGLQTGRDLLLGIRAIGPEPAEAAEVGGVRPARRDELAQGQPMTELREHARAASQRRRGRDLDERMGGRRRAAALATVPPCDSQG
jgi:hypothetical protein